MGIPMAKKKSQKVENKPDVFIPPNCSIVYSDGSYRPDGNAAYAFLVFSHKTQHVTHMERGACRGRTINQMELLAIDKALDCCGDYVLIYSDSMYSISCLTLWHKTWERSNWVTPLNEPVKNKELIQSILTKMRSKKFTRFVHVKAHTGDKFNSVVDYLAQDLTKKMRDDPNLPDGVYPC